MRSSLVALQYGPTAVQCASTEKQPSRGFCLWIFRNFHGCVSKNVVQQFWRNCTGGFYTWITDKSSFSRAIGQWFIKTVTVVASQLFPNSLTAYSVPEQFARLQQCHISTLLKVLIRGGGTIRLMQNLTGHIHFCSHVLATLSSGKSLPQFGVKEGYFLLCGRKCCITPHSIIVGFNNAWISKER